MNAAPIAVHGYDDRELFVGARVLLHPYSVWRERSVAYAVVTRIATRGNSVAVIIEPEAPGTLVIRVRPQDVRLA